MEYLNLAVKAIFVENILLAFLLGMVLFLACSKKDDTATGLGLTVIFVLITVPTNWAINNLYLNRCSCVDYTQWCKFFCNYGFNILKSYLFYCYNCLNGTISRDGVR